MNGVDLLYPLVAVVIQGVNTIVSKLSAGVITPEAITFYRWLLALVVITPLLLRRFLREWPVFRQHPLRMLVLSLLGMLAYQVLVYVAAATTSATNIAIIGSLTPLLTVGFSALLLADRPGLGVLLGCAISLSGVLVLIEHGHPLALLSNRVVMGDVYVLIGAVCFALYGTLLRLWRLPVSASSMYYGQALLALLLVLPGGAFGTLTPLSRANLPLVLFASLGGSVAAPFLWIIAVERVGPVVTAICINLAPLITIAIAIFALGEELRAYHAAGGLLVLAGVGSAQLGALRRMRARAA